MRSLWPQCIACQAVLCASSAHGHCSDAEMSSWSAGTSQHRLQWRRWATNADYLKLGEAPLSSPLLPFPAPPFPPSPLPTALAKAMNGNKHYLCAYIFSNCTGCAGSGYKVRTVVRIFGPQIIPLLVRRSAFYTTPRGFRLSQKAQPRSQPKK